MNQLVMSFGEVQGSQAEDGGACWAGGNLMLGTKIINCLEPEKQQPFINGCLVKQPFPK